MLLPLCCPLRRVLPDEGSSTTCCTPSQTFKSKLTAGRDVAGNAAPRREPCKVYPSAGGSVPALPAGLATETCDTAGCVTMTALPPPLIRVGLAACPLEISLTRHPMTVTPSPRAAGKPTLRPCATASPLISSPSQQSGGNGAQPLNGASAQQPIPVIAPPDFSPPPETYQKVRRAGKGRPPSVCHPANADYSPALTDSVTCAQACWAHCVVCTSQDLLLVQSHARPGSGKATHSLPALGPRVTARPTHSLSAVRPRLAERSCRVYHSVSVSCFRRLMRLTPRAGGSCSPLAARLTMTSARGSPPRGAMNTR